MEVYNEYIGLYNYSMVTIEIMKDSLRWLQANKQTNKPTKQTNQPTNKQTKKALALQVMQEET